MKRTSSGWPHPTTTCPWISRSSMRLSTSVTRVLRTRDRAARALDRGARGVGGVGADDITKSSSIGRLVPETSTTCVWSRSSRRAAIVQLPACRSVKITSAPGRLKALAQQLLDVLAAEALHLDRLEQLAETVTASTAEISPRRSRRGRRRGREFPSAHSWSSRR
jgi:hypothetical protein